MVRAVDHKNKTHREGTSKQTTYNWTKFYPLLGWRRRRRPGMQTVLRSCFVFTGVALNQAWENGARELRDVLSAKYPEVLSWKKWGYLDYTVWAHERGEVIDYLEPSKHKTLKDR